TVKVCLPASPEPEEEQPARSRAAASRAISFFMEAILVRQARIAVHTDGCKNAAAVASAPAVVRHDAVAEHLQQLDKYDQQQHRHHHVIGLVAEVAVAISQVAQ